MDFSDKSCCCPANIAEPVEMFDDVASDVIVIHEHIPLRRWMSLTCPGGYLFENELPLQQESTIRLFTQLEIMMDDVSSDLGQKAVAEFLSRCVDDFQEFQEKRAVQDPFNEKSMCRDMLNNDDLEAAVEFATVFESRTVESENEDEFLKYGEEKSRKEMSHLKQGIAQNMEGLLNSLTTPIRKSRSIGGSPMAKKAKNELLFKSWSPSSRKGEVSCSSTSKPESTNQKERSLSLSSSGEVNNNDEFDDPQEKMKKQKEEMRKSSMKIKKNSSLSTSQISHHLDLPIFCRRKCTQNINYKYCE